MSNTALATSALPPAEASCPSPPLFTFTQGVVVGQASILILFAYFLRYVVFESPSKQTQNASSAASDTSRSSSRRRKKKRRASVAMPAPDAHLLSRLSFNLATHPAESADWLNVLFAQALSGYRTAIINSYEEEGGARGYVEKMLNQGKAPNENPSFVSVDHISVGEVDFGDDFPVLSNARVKASDETGRVHIEADMDYSDHVTLSIKTKVVINFPKPRFAVLPVSLGMTLAKFSATAMIEIPVENVTTPPVMHIALQPNFTLDLKTSSLIGSVAKLQDIPKIEQLIAGRLRAFIVSKWVWPRFKAIKLPDLSSRASASSSEEETTPPPLNAEFEEPIESDSAELLSQGEHPSPTTGAAAYHDADHDSMHLTGSPFVSDNNTQRHRLEEWRQGQPASFIGGHHHPAYTPPWGPGSPLFSPNPSLANSMRARQPAAVSRSASDLSLTGSMHPSAAGVRYRRPQSMGHPLSPIPSLKAPSSRIPSTGNVSQQHRGQRQRSSGAGAPGLAVSPELNRAQAHG